MILLYLGSGYLNHEQPVNRFPMENELIAGIKKDLAIELPGMIGLNELEVLLSVHINQLIQKNFQQLVTLLYRIDINEAKLKQLLQEYADEDAGKIIAQLIIERQLQKIKSRQQFSRRDNDIPEEDKW